MSYVNWVANFAKLDSKSIVIFSSLWLASLGAPAAAATGRPTAAAAALSGPTTTCLCDWRFGAHSSICPACA